MGGQIKTAEIKSLLKDVTSISHMIDYINANDSVNKINGTFTEKEYLLTDYLDAMTSGISRFERSLGKEKTIIFYNNFLKEISIMYDKNKLYNGLTSKGVNKGKSPAEFAIFWKYFEHGYLKQIVDRTTAYIFQISLLDDKVFSQDVEIIEVGTENLFYYIKDWKELERLCDYYSENRIINFKSVKVIDKNSKTGMFSWIGINNSKIPSLAEFLNYLNYLDKLKKFDNKAHQAKCFFNYFQIKFSPRDVKQLAGLLNAYTHRDDFDVESVVYFKKLDEIIATLN